MPKKPRGNVSGFSLTFRPLRGVRDVILREHTSRIHKIIKHVRSPKQTKTSVLAAAATKSWLLAEILAAIAGVMGEIAMSAFFVISAAIS